MQCIKAAHASGTVDKTKTEQLIHTSDTVPRSTHTRLGYFDICEKNEQFNATILKFENVAFSRLTTGDVYSSLATLNHQDTCT